MIGAAELETIIHDNNLAAVIKETGHTRVRRSSNLH
jgi:hypothetical protein